MGGGIGAGVGCYGGGGAVGNELRVGGDVGYYVEDVFGWVGEDACGREGLEGGEGVGEATSLGEGGEVLWFGMERARGAEEEYGQLGPHAGYDGCGL